MKRKSPAGGLSAEDFDSFWNAFRNIKPLQPETDLPAPVMAPARDESAASGVRPPVVFRAAVRDGPPPPPQPVVLDSHRPGRAPGLDRRNALRLRRGEIGIDAKIDLHGMSQEKARDALLRFIADSHGRGRRCVLVITGKGKRSGNGTEWLRGDQIGVLQQMVPRWLAQSPPAPHVVAYSKAAPAHGGGGALYVLLRRKREQ